MYNVQGTVPRQHGHSVVNPSFTKTKETRLGTNMPCFKTGDGAGGCWGEERERLFLVWSILEEEDLAPSCEKLMEPKRTQTRKQKG